MMKDEKFKKEEFVRMMPLGLLGTAKKIAAAMLVLVQSGCQLLNKARLTGR